MPARSWPLRLRTLLNGMHGVTELLLDTELTAEQREYAERLRDSNESLLDAVNAVLDLSKIETGELELEPAFFDLRGMVEDIGDLLRNRAREKGLELTVTIEDEVPYAVRGDRARVRQVLVNLISNAVAFTGGGGIVVSVSAREKAGDKTVVGFEVTDTGVGIDEGTAGKLLEGGGTGLGLVICRHLVDMMRGTIGVRGEPGKGSTFWFAIPLERRTGPGRASDVPRPDALAEDGPGKVLVAEDDVATQNAAVQLLEKRGYDVEVVPNGRQAVEAVTEGEYAVVLMDCHMPEMDGYEATEEIRRREEQGQRTPVIAMTASAMEDDRERCLAAGMDDYLSKPLEPVHVNAVLEYWIGLPDEASVPDHAEEPASAAYASASTKNKASSVLDVGSLEDLRRRTGSGRRSALIVDLVGLYLRDAPNRVEAIQRAVAAEDARALREAARTLRGSSRTLGAARVAELCTELEQIGAAGSVMGAAPLVAQLKQGFALTRRALERELS
jgi:CheY-like chemotaxis protein